MQLSNVGQIERKTQNRVAQLFRDELKYTYLGNWKDRLNNSNIEEELLTGAGENFETVQLIAC